MYPLGGSHFGRLYESMAPRRLGVVLPYPGSGDINPALAMPKLLHHRGINVKLVNSEHNHRKAADAVSRHDGSASSRSRTA